MTKDELVKEIMEKGKFQCLFWKKQNRLFVVFNFRGIEFTRRWYADLDSKIDFKPLVDSLADKIINVI